MWKFPTDGIRMWDIKKSKGPGRMINLGPCGEYRIRTGGLDAASVAL